MTRHKESPAYHEAAKARRAIQRYAAIVDFSGPHTDEHTGERYYKATDHGQGAWAYYVPSDGRSGRVVWQEG